MNRAGSYINVLNGVLQYKAYKPNPLPSNLEIEKDEEFIELLSKAHGNLGKLDAITELIPNIDLFLGSYVRKEALLSSQIEGTQATLEDVFSAENKLSINLDVNDVINYVNALNFAIKRMDDLPICSRLLCETHSVLMQGVRGMDKNPGEFRKSQNRIGTANSTIQNARYIPPTVEDVKKGMNDLETFINNYDMDPIIKTALVHYQFETIHPFLDGNGRIGRMLITLILLNEKVLHRPVLYLSLFLKLNKVEYYDRLSEVRRTGNYEQWIKFFLSGISESSSDSINTILQINKILENDEKIISKETLTVKKVYDYLKVHPIVEIGETAKALKLSFNTISNAFKKLLDYGIIIEKTKLQRNKVFEYSSYINVLKSGT